MTELTLLPLLDNGSNYYTSVSFFGSGYTNAILSVEMDGDGQLWIEISLNGINWFKLKDSTVNIYGSDLIPLQNFNPILRYRVSTTIKVTSIKLNS